MDRFYGDQHVFSGLTFRSNILGIEVLRRPIDVVICERSHEVVAVVIIGLHAELDALVVASLLGCFDKVLGQQLLLLIEVVAGALHLIRIVGER